MILVSKFAFKCPLAPRYVMMEIPKDHQLLIWYGAQWFAGRGLKRIDVVGAWAVQAVNAVDP
jgi:hypothetical protein